jgi:capsular exopolysaccharide synthesis family protein
LTTRELVEILVKGKKWILASLLLLTLAGAVYTYFSTPVFESTARVLIDTKAKQSANPWLDLTGMGSATKLTNEIEGLVSYSMAEGVAQALVRKRRLNDSSRSVISLLEAVGIADSLPGSQKMNALTERVMKSVQFDAIKESDIIKVTARSANPREAALIANTYTQIYAEKNRSISRAKSRAIREFLQTQLQGQKDSLNTTENDLKSYMSRAGVVSLDGETNKLVDQLAALEASRDALDVEIKTKSKTLASYTEELARQEPNFAKSFGGSDDAYIRLRQEELARLEAQRDMLIAQNPELAGQDVKSEMLTNLDSQIATVRKNLLARTQAFVKSLLPGGDPASGGREGSGAYLSQVKQKIVELRIELDGLKVRKAALQEVVAQNERHFNQIPQKSMELARLQRTRLSNEKLYLIVQEKFHEVAMAESSEFGDVNIIDPAVVPVRPVGPKLWLNLLVGFSLGLVGGVALVLLRATLDNRVRTPEDLKRRGYLTLATIAKRDPETRVNGDKNGVKKERRAQLVSSLNPLSPATESYRHLLTSIQFAQINRPPGRLLVTSPAPEEGKSTTIANLAVVAGQAGQKVLLIDADLRRPTLHTIFKLKKEPGLVDLLFGRVSLDTGIHTGMSENVDVVCCGTMPPNPAGVLGSREMLSFLDKMGKIYSLVMIDSAPLLAVTDAAVLGSFVDGIVLVVSAGDTKFPDLEIAAESLAPIGSKVLGVVLNRFDVDIALRGSRGVGYGYYGKHGSYYSTTPPAHEKN